ncbi:hypothetical protein G6045_37400 [Streptomyces sp. YC504]|uniref:Lipoprotein n=1 Tax=Streptomyces mesophilus TaxID=1775132 RepID=A0A6G4XX04_9ACTN|nr:lipoprotein [Streptomyces mesophilus]NGO81300.1 hypothetical protein [Streptomyces mesophilus]
MRSAVVRGVLAAAVMAGLVAGCSGDGDGKGSEASGGKASGAGKSEDSKNGDLQGGDSKSSPPTKAGGSIGAAGSACELPVTFGIAAKWKASAIDTAPDADADSELSEDELAELLEGIATRGPVMVRCEISARATGKAGFLRTYLEEPRTGADPRKVLEGFVAEADGHADEKYTSFKAGPADAVEVVYSELDPLFEEKRTTRAFAVRTPQGTVVVSLEGSDLEDETVVRPAYELAKQSIRVNG